MEKKEIILDKPRIASTVVLGIFLLSSLLIALPFLPLTWKSIVDSANKSDPAAAPIAAFAMALGVVIVIGLYGIVAIADVICLVFAVKNRHSTKKPVRIISYVYDGLFAALIVMSVVKIILYACGI